MALRAVSPHLRPWNCTGTSGSSFSAWNPHLLGDLRAGNLSLTSLKKIQLHHWSFQPKLMGSYPSSALQTSPPQLPQKKPFPNTGTQVLVSAQSPTSAVAVRSSHRTSRASHPRGGQQSGRAQDPLSSTDSWVFNITLLINLTRRLVGQVLCFPERLLRAGWEFSLWSHGLLCGRKDVCLEAVGPVLPCLVLPPAAPARFILEESQVNSPGEFSPKASSHRR